MKYLFSSVSILCFFISILTTSRVHSQSTQEQNEFDYNREIAVDYAKVAVKEFLQESPEDSLDNYNVEQPYVSSVYSQDCNGSTLPIVFVAFFHRDNNRYMMATLPYNEQGKVFSRSLITGGGGIVSPQEEVTKISNADANGIDYWNCGV